jgi:hypothetical protein
LFIYASKSFSVYSKIFHYLTEKSRITESEKIPDRVRRFYNNQEIVGGDVYHHIKFCLQDKLELVVQVSAFIVIW